MSEPSKAKMHADFARWAQNSTELLRSRFSAKEVALALGKALEIVSKAVDDGQIEDAPCTLELTHREATIIVLLADIGASTAGATSL